MKMSENGLSLLKSLEGFRPMLYLCSAGVDTIGYGHAIKPGEDYSNGITVNQGAALLAADCATAETCINNFITVKLSQNQFDALVCLVFNIGCGAFKASSMRNFLNKGDYENASSQFERWVFIKGERSKGLMSRRAQERALFDKV